MSKETEHFQWDFPLPDDKLKISADTLGNFAIGVDESIYQGVGGKGELSARVQASRDITDAFLAESVEPFAMEIVNVVQSGSIPMMSDIYVGSDIVYNLDLIGDFNCVSQPNSFSWEFDDGQNTYYFDGRQITVPAGTLASGLITIDVTAVDCGGLTRSIQRTVNASPEEILLFSHSWSPEPSYGGVSQLTFDVVNPFGQEYVISFNDIVGHSHPTKYIESIERISQDVFEFRFPKLRIADDGSLCDDNLQWRFDITSSVGDYQYDVNFLVNGDFWTNSSREFTHLRDETDTLEVAGTSKILGVDYDMVEFDTTNGTDIHFNEFVKTGLGVDIQRHIGVTTDNAGYSESASLLDATFDYAKLEFPYNTKDSMVFNGNGTRIISLLGDAIYSFPLNAPYDVHGVGTPVGNAILEYSESPQSVAFNANGSKAYLLSDSGGRERVWMHTLSTPWDIQTMTYDGDYYSEWNEDPDNFQFLDISLAVGSPSSIALSSDGLHMYIGDWDGVMHEYGMETPYDVMNATYTQAYSMAPVITENIIYDFIISKDGTKMFIPDEFTGVSIHQFNMDTPWDISTMTLGETLDISAMMSTAGLQPDIRALFIDDVESTIFVMDGDDVLVLDVNGSFSRFVEVILPAIDTTMAVGGAHTIVKHRDGKLLRNGSNSSGELGTGSQYDGYWYLDEFDANWDQVQSVADLGSDSTSIVIRKDGTAWFMGSNSWGVVEGQPTSSLLTPVYMGADFDNAKSINGSNSTLIVIKENGECWGIGRNDGAELGLGHFNNVTTLTRMDAKFDNARQVRVGYNGSIIETSSGELWWAGFNKYGALGVLGYQSCTDELFELYPVQYHNPISWDMRFYGVMIACNDGKTFGAGNATKYSEVVGYVDQYQFVEITELSEVTKVTVGTYAAFAKAYDGYWWGGGQNNDGELGKSGSDFSKIWYSNKFTHMTSSWNNSYAIDISGDLYSAGGYQRLFESGETGDRNRLDVRYNFNLITALPDEAPVNSYYTPIHRGVLGNQFTYMDHAPRASSMEISQDGTKLFTISDSVTEFTMSIPFDITSATPTGVTFALEYGPHDTHVSHDGLTMMAADSSTMEKYTMTVPWDLSTISYTGDSIGIGQSDVRGIAFSADGTRFFTIESYFSITYDEFSIIEENALPAPYDISTYDSIAEINTIVADQCSGLSLSSDGTRIYAIYQYYMDEYTLATSNRITDAVWTSRRQTWADDGLDSCEAFRIVGLQSAEDYPLNYGTKAYSLNYNVVSEYIPDNSFFTITNEGIPPNVGIVDPDYIKLNNDNFPGNPDIYTVAPMTLKGLAVTKISGTKGSEAVTSVEYDTQEAIDLDNGNFILSNSDESKVFVINTTNVVSNTFSLEIRVFDRDLGLITQQSFTMIGQPFNSAPYVHGDDITNDGTIFFRTGDGRTTYAENEKVRLYKIDLSTWELRDVEIAVDSMVGADYIIHSQPKVSKISKLESVDCVITMNGLVKTVAFYYNSIGLDFDLSSIERKLLFTHEAESIYIGGIGLNDYSDDFTTRNTDLQFEYGTNLGVENTKMNIVFGLSYGYLLLEADLNEDIAFLSSGGYTVTSGADAVKAYNKPTKYQIDTDDEGQIFITSTNPYREV